MSRPGDKLREWARPRAWAIVLGLAPILLALVAFGVISGDWVAVSFGVLWIGLGSSLVVTFIVNPNLWEPQNRWRFLGLWIAVGTLVVVSVVIVVFLLT